jgi:16S rRNA (guanine(1405)-N(7))-methyltransferase
LDIACGLNPLALPWMSVPENVTYLAWDIFTDLAQFLNLIFPLLRIDTPKVDGRAEVKDVLALETTPAFDLALLLKTLPCLEQGDKNAGARLLEAIDARWLVVSFPVRSLVGQSKGMPAHYTDQFLRLVDEKPWRVERLDFSTELVFIVEKPL